MGNIINDIVEDINIKQNKSKLVIKWIVKISLVLITTAFIIGQFKTSFFNKLDGIEKTLDGNVHGIIELKQVMNEGFETINKRIDKIYVDGYIAFDEYHEFNNKQLGLIIDYGSSNKDLLKRMLEINAIEKVKNVEISLQRAKSTELNSSVHVKKNIDNPIGTNLESDLGYLSISTSINHNDTIFTVVGATKEFLNQIQNKKYIIIYRWANINNPKLFDIKYKNK